MRKKKEKKRVVSCWRPTRGKKGPSIDSVLADREAKGGKVLRIVLAEEVALEGSTYREVVRDEERSSGRAATLFAVMDGRGVEMPVDPGLHVSLRDAVRSGARWRLVLERVEG